MSQENQASPEEITATSADVRMGRELLQATKPFAVESVVRSWWHVGSTFVLLIAALTGAGLAPWWPLQLLLSILGALLIVRTFITYHDYMHGAILSGSRLAKMLFNVYAAFGLTPPRSWRKSHNYHHGHVGQLSTESVGAFPLITTHMWRCIWRKGQGHNIFRSQWSPEWAFQPTLLHYY